MSEKIRYLVRRAFNSMKEEPYDVDMAWKRVKRQHVRNKRKKAILFFFQICGLFRVYNWFDIYDMEIYSF